MSRSWLYQLSGDAWSEGLYRESVWEGEQIRWPTGKIAGNDAPETGDRMFCWYARTVSRDPGLCGWGVITALLEDDEVVSWRPTFPADLLKMDPVLDDQIDALVSTIRGSFPQGTMWPISRADARLLAERVRRRLGDEVG